MSRKHSPCGKDFRNFHNSQDAGTQNAWKFSDFTYEVNDSREVEIEDLRRVYGEQLQDLPDDSSICVNAEFLEALQFLLFRRDFSQWRNGQDAAVSTRARMAP